MNAPRMLVLGIVLAAGTPTAFLLSKSGAGAAAEARLIEANGVSDFHKTATANDNNRRTGNHPVRFSASTSQ